DAKDAAAREYPDNVAEIDEALAPIADNLRLIIPDNSEENVVVVSVAVSAQA
ncbi:TPA: hypothetical protein OEK38_005292, partial [Escherichia coli]|nr:hypothetical protein [Escherichia coli]HCP6050099.1 hypothetical protein [Escherichia coli]HCS6843277.1 hypothetical protein [Escherichia coli]